MNQDVQIYAQCLFRLAARGAGRKAAGRGDVTARRRRAGPFGRNEQRSSGSLGLRPRSVGRTVTFIPEPNGPARPAAGDHVARPGGRCGMIGEILANSAIIGGMAGRQRAGVDEWTSHGYGQGTRPHRAQKSGTARQSCAKRRYGSEVALRVVSAGGVAGRMGRDVVGAARTSLAFPWP